MNRVSPLSIVTGMMFSIIITTVASAAVPPLLNCQGRIRDSTGASLTGPYSLTFRIYDAEVAGSVLWAEIQNLNVSNGLFSTLLGSVTPLPGDLFSGDERWLGIAVEAEAELPRRRIATAAFASHALYSDSSEFATTVAANSVGTAALVDSAIQNPDLGSGSVNSRTITDLSITGNDIVGGTITGDKIAGNAIISSRIVDASIFGVDIAASQITTSHVVNGSLLGADITDGSITGGEIADGSISAAEILTNSLTGSEILDASIGNADIADAAITSIKIADGTVNSADIGPNAVGASEILADAVNDSKILDEPGVASHVLTATTDLVGSVTLLSRSIDPPASGYVLAIGTLTVEFAHVFNIQDRVSVGLTSTAGTIASELAVASTPADVDNQVILQNIATQAVVAVGAAPETFTLEATGLGGATHRVTRAQLSLIYLPTSYGTVSSP